MDPIVIDRLKKHWSEDYVGRKQDIMDLIAENERLRAEVERLQKSVATWKRFAQTKHDGIEKLRAELEMARMQLAIKTWTFPLTESEESGH